MCIPKVDKYFTIYIFPPPLCHISFYSCQPRPHLTLLSSHIPMLILHLYTHILLILSFFLQISISCIYPSFFSGETMNLYDINLFNSIFDNKKVYNTNNLDLEIIISMFKSINTENICKYHDINSCTYHFLKTALIM